MSLKDAQKDSAAIFIMRMKINEELMILSFNKILCFRKEFYDFKVGYRIIIKEGLLMVIIAFHGVCRNFHLLRLQACSI